MPPVVLPERLQRLMIFRGINARPWQPDSPLANA